MPSLRAIAAEAVRKLDASQIFGRYISLRAAGASLKALCPFHAEKTPSFSIKPNTKLWHCFGCGKGGNAIQFIQAIENISYHDAVRKLADWAGIRFLVEQDSVEITTDRNVLFEILKWTADHYRKTLWSSPYGRRVVEEFLHTRGISEETAQIFGLGLAPPGTRTITQMALERGFTPEALVRSGICVYKAGVLVDHLVERLVFPIQNISGEVIAFAGRVLSDGNAPKYLNTPDSPLFRKGQVLYNLGRARDPIKEAGSVIIVEGYMDVVGLYQAGVRNVVATMGTSITPQQISRLIEFCDRIYVAFDSDAAGQAATQRGIEAFLERKVTPLIVMLPEQKDPDDIARESGREGWNQLVESALAFPAFRLQHLARLYDPSTPEGKDRILNGLFETLARYDDLIFQKPYLTQAADLVGLKPDTIQRRFRKYCAALSVRGLPAGVHTSHLRFSLTTGDLFIAFLLYHPEFLEPPITEVDPETTFQDPVLQRIFRTFVAQERPTTEKLIEELSDDSEASERIALLLHSPVTKIFSREDPQEAIESLTDALGVTRLDYVIREQVSSLLSGGIKEYDSNSEHRAWLISAANEIARRKSEFMRQRQTF